MSVNPEWIKPVYLRGGEVGCLTIHGFTSSPADIRPLSKYLHSRGFTIREVLLPGHGTSFQDMAKYGWSDWVGAVDHELTELKRQCRKVWVIGFSMGGTLAVLAASTGVDGIVSISAPIWPRSKLAKYACFLKYFKRYSWLGERPQSQFPSWRYQWVALKNVADLMHLIKLGKRVLPDITVPALIVQGEEDRTVEPRSANYIFDALGSSDKELVFVSGGHMLLVEAQSKEVCCRISRFLEIRTGGEAHGCCKTGK